MTCAHEDFNAWCDVARLTKVDGGPVAGYSIEIMVECRACGEKFVFLGAQPGVSPRHPTVSMDGTQLRAPIRPVSAPDGWGEDLLSVTVRYTGPDPAAAN